MAAIEFIRPVKGHQTWIVMSADGRRALARIRRAHGRYLAKVYTGQDLGGTHGDKTINVFDSLADAKRAVSALLAIHSFSA